MKAEFVPADRQTAATIAAQIAQMQGRRIVAIDGVDGAGKTTFADTLAPLIAAIGKPVLRASIDGFHNPRAIRHQRGKADPLGYFLDSYNYAAFQEHLIAPFRAGAESVYVARYDHAADQEHLVQAPVPQDAVLLIDGIFLHRDELREHWDFSVFLNVSFQETFRRLAARDGFDPSPFAPAIADIFKGRLSISNIAIRFCAQVWWSLGHKGQATAPQDMCKAKKQPDLRPFLALQISWG